jgi:hydrogenase maturation protease
VTEKIVRYLVGVGNWAMTDDGIGLRVVEAIAERGLDKGFRAVEIAHDLLRVLTWFEPKTERILVVDCVRMGRKPGEVVVFSPDDVRTEKLTGGFSTHEGDLLKTIELARSLGQHVPPIRVLGVEPASMDQGMELSPVLADGFDSIVERAVAELNRPAW